MNIEQNDFSEKAASGLWRMFRRLWPEIRVYRLLMAGALFALIVEIAMSILEPWPLKFIFDHVIIRGAVKGRLSFAGIGNLSSATLLVIAAAAVVIFASLKAAAAYASTVGFALLGNRVVTKIRRDLYERIQCLPLSFHAKARSGDLLMRIISDVGLLQEVAVTAALPLFAHLAVFLGIFSVMLWLNWHLALVVLAVLPVFWLATLRLSRRIRDVARKQRRAESSMAVTASEAVGAIKTVQALSLEDTFSRNFASGTDKSFQTAVKAKRLEAGLERTVDILVAITTAFVVGYGSFFCLRGRLTGGELIVFLSYLKTCFRPLTNFTKYASRLAKATASAERILEVLDLIPQIRNLPGAVKAGAFKGKVEFRNVYFSYEEGKLILDNINFVARPGERVVIIAPSGAGKTTLASLIMRFYEPQRGQVLIDDHDIRFYLIDSLRSQISVVLQETLLFAASVRENIAYGVSGATQEGIEEAARLAQAHDFITRMLQGYDTIVGERGVTLSQGQRQRIAIARAAIRRSPILILDEPAVNLDKENERQINAALEKVSHGRTTFLITHDIFQAEKADVVLYLQDGRLLSQGSHEELTRNNQEYASLFRRDGQ